MSAPVFRVARPTDQLERVSRFYREALGFDTLASFRDHDGFDGEIVGYPGAPWHLEFVARTDGLPAAGTAEAARAPSEEHLLALYFATPAEYEAAVARAKAANAHRVPAGNPYWDRLGATFADPDGWRVVLVNSPWPRKG